MAYFQVIKTNANTRTFRIKGIFSYTITGKLVKTSSYITYRYNGINIPAYMWLYIKRYLHTFTLLGSV